MHNYYKRKEQWVFSDVVEENFYNLVHLNFDSFNVKNKTEKALCQIYISLDINSMTHYKEVIQLMDFLGNIAGIKDLLILIAIYCFGGYADFYKYFQ